MGEERDRQKMRYEVPRIVSLFFAEGAQCMTGAHFFHLCNMGVFAERQCAVGYGFLWNECYAGPSNM
ncbi:MAG: hypothetical protein Fur0020_10140 [Thermodesulfovibrionia bacterium]